MLSLEMGKNLSLNNRRSSNLVNKYSIDAATTIPIAGKGPIGRKRQWPVAGLWVEVCDRVTPLQKVARVHDSLVFGGAPFGGHQQ